uniref:Uncharacterized mitochondrial protein AtMg00820-like n=1 Tax=Tanacetum cinerariifolium TaxID=118510 RepID=A0A6L2NSN4_TANCI|nr:uncharacterized mitochondrial protein AtMg00820-like [Tanacetum cinerariifolium]
MVGHDVGDGSTSDKGGIQGRFTSDTTSARQAANIGIYKNVQREIINHMSFRHPNIVRFKEVILMPAYLAIVMKYTSGGELFEWICIAGQFPKDERNIEYPRALLIDQ